MLYGAMNVSEREAGHGMQWHWRQFIAVVISTALEDIHCAGGIPKERREHAKQDAIEFFESGRYETFAEAIGIEPRYLFALYRVEKERADNPGPKRKKPPLSKSEKTVIRNMRKGGKMPKAIGEAIGRDRSTVSKYLKRVEERGNKDE